MKRWLTGMVAALLAAPLFAEPYIIGNSAVSVKTCRTQRGTRVPFILVIPKGQYLMASLLACADAAKINAATFSGIGQLSNPTRMSNPHANTQTKQVVLSGQYALLSLQGNLALMHGNRIIHATALLGKPDGTVLGVELADAKIHDSVEVTLSPLAGKLTRKKMTGTDRPVIDTVTR